MSGPAPRGEELLNLNAQSYARLREAVPATGDSRTLALELSADWASRHHAGFFRDPALEAVLPLASRPAISPRRSRRALFVMTQAYATGGHSRLVWRWLQAFPTAVDVVITSQGGGLLPDSLRRVANERGARIFLLDTGQWSFGQRARSLARLIDESSMAVLATHAWDVAASAAAANARAPLIWLGHNDYNFTLIPPELALSVEIRRASQALAQIRRGLAAVPSRILPVPLDVPVLKATRQAARRALGVESAGPLVVTVAPWHRYTGHGELNYLHLAEEILKRDEAVILHAVGARPSEGFARLSRLYAGRISALGQQETLAPWHAAADAFLECVPWGSYTAALEFAALDVPVVTYRPIDPHADLGVDEPTTWGVVEAGNTEALPKLVETLLDTLNSPSTAKFEAAALGERVRAQHTGEGWREQVIALAEAAPSLRNTSTASSGLGVTGRWDRALAEVQCAANQNERVEDVRRGLMALAPWPLRAAASLSGASPWPGVLPYRLVRPLRALRAKARRKHSQ